jgi:hypothetical protein
LARAETSNISMASETVTWRNCNMCKVGIGFEASYFVCSVSTCNRKRTGLIFCSLACFEAHLPTARHRDAWAESEKAPSRAAWAAEREREESAEARPAATTSAARAPAASGVAMGAPAAPARSAQPATPSAEVDNDVLVVVSKLKKYVRDWSGMNTSDGAMPVISEYLRELCREAIRQAGQDGRRTVLDRDFTKVIAQRSAAVSSAVKVQRRDG